MKILLVTLITAAVAISQSDALPSANQLSQYKNSTKKAHRLTTSAGAPVHESDLVTMNEDLMNSEYLMDALTHLVRERIPERVVHAGGTGGFGEFVVTHDITHICKAKMFSKIGKKTPVAMRFSPSAPRRGSKDTDRGSRGIAIKCYTEEGNMDFTCFNFPMFAFRECELSISLIHIMKPNPVTDLPDPNMSWDYLTQNPETLFANMYLLSDYGAPASYSDITAHAIHTYQVYNASGFSSYVRFHFIPAGGAKYLNATEYAAVASGDNKYYARGLYNKIANGTDLPTWIMYVQVLSEEDRKNADMDIFDVTQRLSEKQYPLQEVGKLVLNKNPNNSFADIEQLAFSPGNFVPGIVGSPDSIFKCRRFSYRDAQLYRLGSNFNKIPVNCPLHTPYTYIRDGVPPLDKNQGGAPNYNPNSFNGPVPYSDPKRPELIKITEVESGDVPPNFKQFKDFYNNELTEPQRTTFIANLVASLGSTTVDELKTRALKHFKNVDTDLAEKVSAGLASAS